jgi:hypothetical protein
MFHQIPRTYYFESSAPDRMKLREEMVQIPPLAVVRWVAAYLAPRVPLPAVTDLLG